MRDLNLGLIAGGIKTRFAAELLIDSGTGFDQDLHDSATIDAEVFIALLQ